MAFVLSTRRGGKICCRARCKAGRRACLETNSCRYVRRGLAKRREPQSANRHEAYTSADQSARGLHLSRPISTRLTPQPPNQHEAYTSADQSARGVHRSRSISTRLIPQPTNQHGAYTSVDQSARGLHLSRPISTRLAIQLFFCKCAPGRRCVCRC